MTIQMSDAVRNALLDAIEVNIGASAKLKIRTGAQPATCATADSGTVIATLDLDADWMNAAGSGQKTFKGTWTDSSADNPGTAAHFRLYASDGATCGMQGSITATGNGGDMTLDNIVLAAGQSFSITAFTLTAPGA
jgi:hypothetical protein